MTDSKQDKGMQTKYSSKNALYSDTQDEFVEHINKVVINFPFKNCVLECGMTKEDNKKREERFLSRTTDKKKIDTFLEEKVLTNFKLINENGEKNLTKDDDIEFFDKNGELKQNLLIKGNNLLALHTLENQLAGKVKLIYIDPPYNTGSNSFNYNDNFNHSTWLVFMKNRLEIAKKLLRDDGVIFVQIDDNEQAYLKVLMDEIFGRENFVKTIHVQMSVVQGNKVRAAKNGNIVKNGEYIHVFSINGNKNIGFKPLYEPTEYDTHYSIYIDANYNEIPLTDFCLLNNDIKNLLILANLIKKDKLSINNLGKAYNEIEIFRHFIHDNAQNIARIHSMVAVDEAKIEKNLFLNKTYKYIYKNKVYLYGVDTKGQIKARLLLSDKLKKCDDYYSSYKISTIRGDWWAGFHIDMGNINKESITTLKDGQKPERLLKNIIEFATQPHDLILDYHLGSGTTCAVAHKMNRRYIGIEQMDYIEEISKVRLQRVIDGEQGGISKAVSWQGGGSFVYFELKKYNQKYVQQIIQAESKEHLNKIYKQIQQNAFLQFWFDKKDFENKNGYETLNLDEQKNKLLEILDENQLYLNKKDVQDSKHQVSADEQILTEQFYKKNK
jgi:adenine-specific DNA-methyltransferase